ncbi:hypothetical protein KUCAC02_026543 [Chaenocephalus aceratus]|nr:hypothetical protein KUCAC02_026543 [Chaenocephalus aceratus]
MTPLHQCFNYCDISCPHRAVVKVRRGDSLADRLCFQLFITSGAKVSGERPGGFVLLMQQTVSSVTGGGRLRTTETFI